MRHCAADLVTTLSQRDLIVVVEDPHRPKVVSSENVTNTEMNAGLTNSR